MLVEELGFVPCTYQPAYSSRCGRLSAKGVCDAHSGRECAVCGDESTHQCSYAGQFVCGQELCVNCEGWNDDTKSSGNWGFMNHAHRRKLTAPPILKMTKGDLEEAS